MARRLYLGRLPIDARSDEVAKYFEVYGHIIDVRVMTGFGFVEFESSRDAEDALNTCNGKSFMGANIVVEFAKESRPKRDNNLQDYNDRPRGTGRRQPGHSLIVSGISRETSWQDLKDFGRGPEQQFIVSFADIDRNNTSQGTLEYMSREDADHAVKLLDGKELRGQVVQVTSHFDRDDRRDDRYRDHRDKYREDRPVYRRVRSRSPAPRREVYARRRESPPRREDERRSSGYERGGERRPQEPLPREAREDRRREKRDEKDDRHDDRAPRYSNGDAGYR